MSKQVVDIEELKARIRAHRAVAREEFRRDWPRELVGLLRDVVDSGVLALLAALAGFFWAVDLVVRALDVVGL